MAEFLCTNVDPSVATRIEQQTRTVKLDHAVAPAAALGVPLASLPHRRRHPRNDRQIQEHLADLAVTQRNWEADPAEVPPGRFRCFSANPELLRWFASGDAGPGVLLAPELQDAIDTQISAEDGS